MRIKNNALRKLEAKRLYLHDYDLHEIADLTGSNLIELDKWRIENAWDNEKRLFIENKKQQRANALIHLNKLLNATLTPETLSTIILIVSSLPMSDIQDISKKIFNKIKGEGNE